MLKIKAAVGAAVAVIAIGGLVTIAPPASAVLCGYPPVECPAGDTNPPVDQPIGNSPASRAQAGMTLPSQDTADQTPPSKPPAPPSKNAIGDAPKIPAARGDIVKVRTDVAPKVTYRVLVKRDSGPYNFVGTVIAKADGSVDLPAVQFDRKGTYTFALQDGTGTTIYVRVEVA